MLFTERTATLFLEEHMGEFDKAELLFLAAAVGAIVAAFILWWAL